MYAFAVTPQSSAEADLSRPVSYVKFSSRYSLLERIYRLLCQQVTAAFRAVRAAVFRDALRGLRRAH
jgi:hypothetical protein